MMQMIRRRRRKLAPIVALGAALAAGAAAAQQQPAPPAPPKERGTLSFVLENDLFVDTDRHYTNGVRLSWLTAPGDEPDWIQDAAGALPMFAEANDIRVEFALGQSMFTPNDTRRVVPDPADRPYAGWLYGNVGVVAETGRRLDQLALGIGVVGPLSLAEQTQKLVHDIRGFRKPKGWDSQLKNEPTVQLTWQTSWRALASGPFLGFQVDATPHGGLAIGNVFDHVNAGLTVRLGQYLPDDFGPPRVEPSLPGSGFFKSDGFGWYLFAGVDGRAVARNMFLDGNTFRDGPEVDKKHFVGDLQLGIAMVIEGVRIAYTHVLRTKEFDRQNRPDRFGAVSISTKF